MKSVYPCVECNKEKLLQNIETLSRMMHADGKIMCAVIKGFCADDSVMEVLEESSVDWIADSRIEDLERQMKEAAARLDFEEAARLRDIIRGMN